MARRCSGIWPLVLMSLAIRLPASEGRAAPRRPDRFAIIFNMGYAGDHLPRDPASFERLVRGVREARFNTILGRYEAWRARVCEAHDVRLLVDLLAPGHHVYKEVEAARRLCESLRGREVVYGYHLWSDEIGDSYPGRSRDVARVREWDPTHPVYVGSYRMRRVSRVEGLDLLGYYDFHWKRGGHFAHLAKAWRVARDRDARFLRYCDAAPGRVGVGNASRVGYTIATSIPFGLEGYLFHYGGGVVDPATGALDALGQDLRRVNSRIAPLGEVLLELGLPLAVESTHVTTTPKDRPVEGEPSVPDGLEPISPDAGFRVTAGEVLVGRFRDPRGRDVAVFASHNAYRAQSVSLAPTGERAVEIYDPGARRWRRLVPEDDAVSFRVEAGGVSIVRLDGEAGSTADPNEARGAAPPYQATGVKIGEVTPSSAIVWTRLTLRPRRNPEDGPLPEFVTPPDREGGGRRPRLRVVWPEGVTVADIRGAVPGTPGEVRVLYRPEGSDRWRETGWRAVDPARDFTRQFRLGGLRPATAYRLRIEARAGARGPAGPPLVASLRTAPEPDAPARVVFTVSTGQGYRSRDDEGGYRIYPAMLGLDPSFFVHTGDIVYYDRLAKSLELARYHWQRTYSLPGNVEFHRHVASYFIKDDHDTWQNDCWPTMTSPPAKDMGTFTFAQGLEVFREQVPMGERTYRTCRWGRDLQVWLVEGRDFRSANTDPDGPGKTIWGAEQKAWFRMTVEASDATFRILVSPTPLVGPDRARKNDNHSNRGFTHEGDELRRFIASQRDMAIVCGDRHWQYVSVHPETGVREYSCGPVSDRHAGGWRDEDLVPDMHRYLKVRGGFLSVTVERVDGRPRIAFRHHDPDGKVLHEDRWGATEAPGDAEG